MHQIQQVYVWSKSSSLAYGRTKQQQSKKTKGKYAALRFIKFVRALMKYTNIKWNALK